MTPLSIEEQHQIQRDIHFEILAISKPSRDKTPLNIINSLFALYIEKQKKQINFNAINLATLLHRIAVQYTKIKSDTTKNEIQQDILNNNVLNHIQEIAHNFDARGIASILWSLATLGFDTRKLEAPLYNALMLAIFNKASEFNAQGITNTLWALASMKIKWRPLSLDLKNALLDAINRNAAAFIPQATIDILWALKSMRIKWSYLHWVLKASLLNAINRNVAAFTPQAITDALWALVNMEIELQILPPDLKQNLLTAIENNLGSFDLQDLLEMWRSLAILSIQPTDELKKSLLAKTTEKILQASPALSVTALMQWVWTLTTFSIYRTTLSAELQELLPQDPAQLPRSTFTTTTPEPKPTIVAKPEPTPEKATPKPAIAAKPEPIPEKTTPEPTIVAEPKPTPEQATPEPTPTKPKKRKRRCRRPQQTRPQARPAAKPTPLEKSQSSEAQTKEQQVFIIYRLLISYLNELKDKTQRIELRTPAFFRRRRRPKAKVTPVAGRRRRARHRTPQPLFSASDKRLLTCLIASISCALIIKMVDHKHPHHQTHP